MNDFGNLRLDTLTNLLDDPNRGMIFLVPGKRETLRISGTAQIVRDQWLREGTVHQSRLPDLAIVVTVNRLLFPLCQMHDPVELVAALRMAFH